MGMMALLWGEESARIEKWWTLGGIGRVVADSNFFSNVEEKSDTLPVH
jgi:hypothetical protein